MKRTKLLLLLFIIGLSLMIFSWFLSYPLKIDSTEDFLFNHVSILYWISLPILLTAMFLIAINQKNYYSNWLISFGMFMIIYSLSYFFFRLPGPDAHYFTGLNENYLKTNSLVPNAESREYYQWPSFFVLAKVITSVAGLDLANYQFLLYAVMGLLISTAIFVYASKFSKYGGIVAVIAFAVVMRSFLNYQFAPFSLAFTLLLVLFTFETKPRSNFSMLIIIVLFASICIMHAFTALFFVLYLLIRSITDKSAYYRNLFVLSIIVYLVSQVSLVTVTLGLNINRLIEWPSGYSSIVSKSLEAATVPIDQVAQVFSRGTTISLGLISVLGFAHLLIKKKLRHLDISILLTGVVYSSVGAVLYILGGRAIPLLFLPVSLGAVCLLEGRKRHYLMVILLVLLVFVTFISLHNSFGNSPIIFQTKEEQLTSEFLLMEYDWASHSRILMHVSSWAYIFPQVDGKAEIVYESSVQFTSNITYYDFILYSVGLGINLNSYNISSSQILNKRNLIYNSCSSFVVESTPE